MKLFDQTVELSIIKSITSPKIPEHIRLGIMAKLTADHFHYPPAREAFARIDTIAKKRFVVVDYDDLISDPAIKEDSRDIIRESDARPASKKTKLTAYFNRLDEFRKIRVLYKASNAALEAIESDSVDIDATLEVLHQALLKTQGHLGLEDRFLNIGMNNNADKVVDNILNKVKDDMMPTGFTEYDNRNGGIPNEGVMILGATTSGGKSTVLMNILVHLYRRLNKKTYRISLEMGEEQETARLLSHLSQVPFWKIKQNKMTPEDKKKITRAYDKFKQHGVENNCVFATLCPTRGISSTEALRTLKAFGPEVVGIDYVSLFEDADGDGKSEAQWQRLSAIVKQAKIFSRECKCLVIVLVQIDDESNKIRYAKGMKEHADVVWQWNYSKPEQRELRVIPVDVTKARDGELMPFNLAESYDVMTVRNMEDTGYGSSSSGGDDDGFARSKESSKSDIDNDDDQIPEPKRKKKKKDKRKNDLEEESYAVA